MAPHPYNRTAYCQTGHARGTPAVIDSLQNLFALAPMIKQTRGFVMSAGDGQVGMIDARDEAAAAFATAPTAPAEHRAAMIRAGVPEAVATSNAQAFGLIAEGSLADRRRGDNHRHRAAQPAHLHHRAHRSVHLTGTVDVHVPDAGTPR